MLIFVLLFLVVVENVVASPVVTEFWVHLAEPKSAICQIVQVLGVCKDSEIK